MKAFENEIFTNNNFRIKKAPLEEPSMECLVVVWLG